ncbi:unnamed protein product [Ostreobium quekettii]|uniref:Importin-7/11-like TPR repeats domain-containing protein n=1 Tax=Ostreobium quekettii TaxID=121088 RepID=A0A8S1IP11_9CHLO|nr:unnamed protein product [Ostreobium quekettii]
MASQVQQPLQSFWRDAHAQALCEALVHKYFVLTAADLEKWASSPEDFYHGNDGGNTSENLRGSMELLFSVLLRTYREQLAPVVAQMLHSAPAVSSALEPVLVREAIYAAVCIGSSDLYDYVDFGSWFRTALMQELGDTTPAHSPLRRRAALVVSSWVSKLSEGDRVLAYKLLVELLAEADMCLKLSAVKSLRELIDDWDFKEKAFEPFVSPCLELLCAALRSSEELDTHIQVFSLFNLIIERMLGDIKQLAPSLAQLLPHIWEQAQEQNLLRMQVLIAYQHLINALGADSPSTYQWVIPMISHSVNVDHPDSLNLMEDGLELLLVALRNAPMHTGEPLLEVVQQLGKILERSAEMVPLLMRIMSSCILLGGASLLTRYGSALSAMLCSLIGNVRDSAYHLICRVLEIALKVAPTEALQAFEDPIRQLLGVLMSMSREGSFDSLVFAQGCVVFGRVLLMDVQYFWQFFQKSAQSGMFGDADGAKLMMGFVDLWMDQFDALPSEAARKLCALALCNLLTIPCPQVLGQLGPILACITAVCHELEGGVLPQRQVDASGDRSYGFANESMMHEQLGVAAIGSEDAQPEVDRKREVYTADPSNSLKVSQYFKQKLAEAGSVHGATFNAAVSSVHPTLVEQVKSIVGT